MTANGRMGGKILADGLKAQGVDAIFGVPGESFLALLDGLYDQRDTIRFITCRQEGGAANMAEAYGKLTGRPGVRVVTRGPGATNASVGLHTAFQDSTPMILLTAKSDDESKVLGTEIGANAFLGKPFNDQELISLESCRQKFISEKKVQGPAA